MPSLVVNVSCSVRSMGEMATSGKLLAFDTFYLCLLCRTHSHAGFLNAYFSDWFSRPAAARLPFRYNALRTVYWTTHDKNPGYWEAIGPVKVRRCLCSSM